MTELLTHIPAILNIEVSGSDDFPYLVDADINLTGYTFVAKIEHYNNNSTTDITVTAVDLSAGQVMLSLTDEELSALVKGAHKWYFEWTVGSSTRRIIKGKFTII